MKRARSDFSLLARAVLYGTDNVDAKKIDEMRKSLRSNLPLIFKSPMPLNRKIMSLAIASNYRLTSKIIDFVKK